MNSLRRGDHYMTRCRNDEERKSEHLSEVEQFGRTARTRCFRTYSTCMCFSLILQRLQTFLQHMHVQRHNVIQRFFIDVLIHTLSIGFPRAKKSMHVPCPSRTDFCEISNKRSASCGQFCGHSRFAKDTTSCTIFSLMKRGSSRTP